jgi:O-antigen/teichoic acid export membrane protein
MNLIKKILPLKYHYILTHHGFRRYFLNTGWMFMGQFLSLVVAFFIGAWIARYLGPSQYGIFQYAIAFVSLFSVIANLGIDVILNRELVKQPEKRDELLGTGFRLKLIGGVFTILLILVAIFFINFDSLSRLLIIIYSFSFVFHPLNVIGIYFQAKVEAKNNVKAHIFTIIASSTLKVLFIILALPLFYLIIIYTLESLWQVIGLYYTYKKKKLKLSNWRFRPQLAKTLFKDSWPLILANAAAFIYLRIDQVMIEYFLDQTAVGLYAAAVKFAEVWYFIPGIICASLFPAIVNSKISNTIVYKQRLKRLYLLMLTVAIAIAIPTTFLAPIFVPAIFGIEYTLSVPILQIYIWSGVGLFLGWAINQYLISENKAKLLFKINAIAMVTNISLNLILIPIIGLNGAAWTTLISYMILPVVILLKKSR